MPYKSFSFWEKDFYFVERQHVGIIKNSDMGIEDHHFAIFQTLALYGSDDIMQIQRFLVTGCAGFIGGHVVDKLIAMGHEVTGIDDFSTGCRDNMRQSQGRFRFVEGSVCDKDLVARTMMGMDRVIHLASVPSVPRSLEDPLESVQASVVGTVTLLDAARKAGVRRVVQAASSSAYGDTEVLPKVESMLPAPISPYAVAKLTQEYYAAAFYRCYGLDSVSLRYFNVFGPRQSPESLYAAVIPKFISLMSKGERPQIFGDGEQTRDFTYIDNVVDANIQAALSPNPMRGAVANIGAGRAASLNELVELLNRLLGTDLAAEYKPMRAGDVQHSLAAIDKAHELFGYEPTVHFAEGVEKTVQWFRNGEI